MAGQQYIGTARWGLTQSIPYTTSVGTIPTGVSAGVYKVRVLTSTDAFVTADGTTPSATNGTYVPALTYEHITVTPGQHLAAIQVAAAGTLYTTECI